MIDLYRKNAFSARAWRWYPEVFCQRRRPSVFTDLIVRSRAADRGPWRDTFAVLRCLRRLLLVMGRIPLQMRHLRHILGQERRLGHKSLPRKGLAPPTNSEGSKHRPAVLRARRPSPIIDLYRKNAFSARA